MDVRNIYIIYMNNNHFTIIIIIIIIALIIFRITIVIIFRNKNKLYLYFLFHQKIMACFIELSESNPGSISYNLYVIYNSYFYIIQFKI